MRVHRDNRAVVVCSSRASLAEKYEVGVHEPLTPTALSASEARTEADDLTSPVSSAPAAEAFRLGVRDVVVDRAIRKFPALRGAAFADQTTPNYEEGPVPTPFPHSPGWTRTNNPPVNGRLGRDQVRPTRMGKPSEVTLDALRSGRAGTKSGTKFCD